MLHNGFSFTRAFQVCRLLLGGLGHGPRRRGAEERAAYPKRCNFCGEPAVRWSFITPGPQGLDFSSGTPALATVPWESEGGRYYEGAGP